MFTRKVYSWAVTTRKLRPTVNVPRPSWIWDGKGDGKEEERRIMARG